MEIKQATEYYFQSRKKYLSLMNRFGIKTDGRWLKFKEDIENILEASPFSFLDIDENYLSEELVKKGRVDLCQIKDGKLLSEE